MTKESEQEVTVMPKKSVDDVLSVVLFSSKKSGYIWAGLWARDHLLTVQAIEVSEDCLQHGEEGAVNVPKGISFQSWGSMVPPHPPTHPSKPATVLASPSQLATLS